MDVREMKNFIRKNIVDFTELIINHYYKLGLDETDAIMVIKLHNLLQKGITFIKPTKLANILSISPQTVTRRLHSLIERGFIRMELIEGKDGKETETFNLDFLIERIIKSDFEQTIAQAKDEKKTVEKQLAQLFEEEFRKPLSVLDIQTITKWIHEDHYTVEEIKDALFVAVKAHKLSIKYVDGVLLRTEKESPKKYKKTNLARDMKQLWTK